MKKKPKGLDVGVYARADHPEGYGSGDGTAHGYSVALVYNDTKELLPQSLELPVGDLAYGGNKWWNKWYGGRFELVAVLKSLHPAAPTAFGHSIGDNRSVVSLALSDIGNAGTIAA